jgi:hypothetical protein
MSKKQQGPPQRIASEDQWPDQHASDQGRLPTSMSNFQNGGTISEVLNSDANFLDENQNRPLKNEEPINSQIINA